MRSQWNSAGRAPPYDVKGKLDRFVRCERVVMGFVCAVLAPAAVCYPALVAANAADFPYTVLEHMAMGMVIAPLFIVAFVTGPAALFLGIPVFFLFRKMDWKRWQAHAAGGWLIGMGYAAALGILTGEGLGPLYKHAPNSPEFAMFSVCGGLSALIFWSMRTRRAAIAWASLAGMFAFLVVYFAWF